MNSEAWSSMMKWPHAVVSPSQNRHDSKGNDNRQMTRDIEQIFYTYIQYNM